MSLSKNLVRFAAAAVAVAGITASAQSQSRATDPDNSVIMDLKCGEVVIQMWPDVAPKHVERIKTLTRDGFYNGVVFHRVIEGFMAQTGDPTGTGTGSSKLPDLPAEFNDKAFLTGVVGMARSTDPNSANSQFFITFKPARFLDNQYTAFGKVVSGMNCINQINRGEPPANPDKVLRMRVGGRG